MMTTKHDLDAVIRTTGRRMKAEQEWKQSIVSAANEGQSLRAIGKAAAISHTRVHQIVAEMREGGFRAGSIAPPGCR